MTGPEVRREMRDFAQNLSGTGPALMNKPALVAMILRWERELRRRPSVRKAAPVRTMTPAKHQEVVRLLASLPDADYQEIATLTGVNTGRVSEIAAGKRT